MARRCCRKGPARWRTLAVKSPMIDVIQNVTNQVKSAADSGGDARVPALRGYAAASGAVGAFGEAKCALSALEAGKTPEAKIELSFGSSSSGSTSFVDSTQNVAGNIKAGDTAAFIATGDAASGKGNVNIIGGNIDAKDVLLQANHQVNVLSSEDTESTRSDNDAKGGTAHREKADRGQLHTRYRAAGRAWHRQSLPAGRYRLIQAAQKDTAAPKATRLRRQGLRGAHAALGARRCEDPTIQPSLNAASREISLVVLRNRCEFGKLPVNTN